MQFQQFYALAQEGYNRIPLTQVVMADLDTPVSAYAKLATGPYSFLFESVQGGEKWGRYSIIGLPCKVVLKVFGEEISVESAGRELEHTKMADPLDFVEQFQQRYSVPDLPDLPAFFGGFVGYFAYDTVRYVEPRLKISTPPDELNTPDILLMLTDDVLVFDNLASKIHIVTHIDVDVAQSEAELQQRYAQGQQRLIAIAQQLQHAHPILDQLATTANDGVAAGALQESDFSSGFTQADYHVVVEKIKDYTLAGDVMQVVPSQRMSAPFSAPPINLYRALRSLNPSPYMYFLDLGDFHIVGSSPEILALSLIHI